MDIRQAKVFTYIRKIRWEMKKLIIVIGFSLVLSGCCAVQPWEKAKMGDYLLRGDRDPLSESLAEHIYFTREAATGGRSVGGGGCGCN